MSRYIYQAVTATGKTVKGALDAQSLDHANEQISARGLIVADVAQAAAGDASASAASDRWRFRLERVHSEDLILFTKQLSTMLRAGIPMLRAFEILESQTENAKLKAVCGAIASDLRGGGHLHRALRRHPNVFSPLYVSMVLAGETSGALPQVLQRLIYVISHEYKVKCDVRSVIQYPIIVLLALGVAFAVLITLVIPRFAAVYTRADVVLPLPTRLCLALSTFLRTHWGGLVLVLVAGCVALYAWTRREAGRYWCDRMLLRIPLVGSLLIKAALSRLASIFSILQATGIGILDSIPILSETIGNRAIGRELSRLQSQLEAGRGIARPLMSARYFTPMFINMVSVGEETGNLDEMLREISLHYDAEVEYATRRLTTAMGPTLIVLLAVMVGFFALAVYLPMWDMARIITGAG